MTVSIGPIQASSALASSAGRIAGLYSTPVVTRPGLDSFSQRSVSPAPQPTSSTRCMRDGSKGAISRLT
jgi:hypothetical protein